MSMTIKLSNKVSCCEGFALAQLHDPSITWSCEIMWHCLITKLISLVIWGEKMSPIKLHDLLRKWIREATRQIYYLVFPLAEHLQIQNWARW